MTIAILATGDELIYGDTLNTNGRDIAHHLSSEGLLVGLQLMCTDKEEEIVDCLKFLLREHDTIITTGGLGPTTDDLTRFALAKLTSTPLVEHEEALAHIQQRINAFNKTMNAGNRQQSLFPESAQLLPNPHGTAMGCIYKWQDKTFILLPGPPKECLPMFQQYAFPSLQKTIHTDKQLLKWRIFGLAESEIAETLEAALAPYDCKKGYRLEVPYVEFKVWCDKELVSTIEDVVNPLVAPHLISPVEKRASVQLRELIAKHQLALRLKDEVTGGHLETVLVKPDTHKLMHNTDSEISFSLKGLKEYWANEAPGGQTILTIEYQFKDKQGQETFEIPYRSANVIFYATEWLSYRMREIILSLAASGSSQA